MGLSTEERYDKIVWSIHDINQRVDNLKETYRTNKLVKLVGDLWYEFLRNESNGAYWIMGSPLGNDYMKGGNLIANAFECAMPKSGKDPFDVYDDDDEEVEQTDVLKEKKRFFEYHKTARRMTDMIALLDQEKSAVVRIYLNIENISYALCRYKDEFLAHYESFNHLLRTMQGECYSIMRTDPDYSHAWMVGNFCDKILTWEENDVVNKWWQKQCCHHYVKPQGQQKYEEVYELYKKYQFKDLSVQDRIDITFFLMGEKYGEFPRQHQEFLKMVDEYNSTAEEELDVEKIQKMIDTAIEKKKEEKEKPYYRHCDFTGNYTDGEGEVKNLDF